ncbi:MAG: hypothetical protein OZ921_04605 [Sorangiineae bacterium]|nr:hypothetical protein [Polyangiaceae bacterium]MEB2321772.1 hypothetical protein [Sorangiineae bacterium]
MRGWFGAGARVAALTALFGAAVMTSSCTRGAPARSASPPIAELRDDGRATRDPEIAGRWLIGELISPGGDARSALDARKKLDELGGEELFAELARGLDDELHGRLSAAPEHFLRATRAARGSDDPDAPLFAWFAAHRAMALRRNDPSLFERWRPFVEEAMKEPRAIGWRARSELVGWWGEAAYDAATKDLEARSAAAYGCATQLRLAGPFGRGVSADVIRRFPAEDAGPWPARWQPEPGVGSAPRILETRRRGCSVSAKEPVSGGVFYAETYLELPAARDLIIAVQGAITLSVDDRLVLDRDPRRWGVWPRFGAQVRLQAGRHRVLARVSDAQTSMRILTTDGRPAELTGSTDASAGYSIAAPEVTGDPNVLDRYIRDGNVVDPGSDFLRYASAYLADVEGQDDVANLLIEPLIADPKRAAGAPLVLSAAFVAGDPVFDDSQRKDLARVLHERAVKRDPGLWRSALALAVWEAERGGAAPGVPRVKALVERFPGVPDVYAALAQLYSELGWSAEYNATVNSILKQFPNDLVALTLGVGMYDSTGQAAKADELVARVMKLDPDSELALSRALAREDYPAALAELRRIGERRPERKDLTERIYDVMVRAGDASESFQKLEQAIKDEPRDGAARLALADASFAAGKHDALYRALVDAVVSGAESAPLKGALDLIEGMSELAPYRLDGLSIIKAYEASGRHMPGTAARVLDYSAIWVHSDGSSRMLEHEIVRIQSPEAVSQLAEQKMLDGLVLYMRVIKKDGRVLEPELVAGKPTVTFPHLEVGDFIETEHIVGMSGDGQRGQLYVGPHWFFREENIAYARSEFVVISPDDKPLDIERRGTVPEPVVSEADGVTIHRWRVDYSPAAPVEPASAPITEFLPSVQVGWGVTLDKRLRRLADSVVDLAPMDPRIVRIAREIVKDAASTSRLDRATRLYRWVLANVEDGPETDGRRVIVGKHGNRWRGFMTLCRALGIPVSYAVAQNRLASPPVGPMSSASLYTEPLLRLEGDRGPVWLTVSSKFAPFGYVPAEVRGMPAYLLSGATLEKLVTPTAGGEDGVVYEGTAALQADGSATLELSQKFMGKYAMAVRSALAELPESRLHDIIESRLLGSALHGARLSKFELVNLDQLDAPLVLRMTASQGGFAQRTGQTLIVSPPFMPRISQLATLPVRQTPLLIAQATHQEVRLTITLPPGARLASTLASGTIRDGERSVTVKDGLRGATLVLDRTLDLPAGRVQPDAYPSFVQFASRADDALFGSIQLKVE